MKTNKALCAEKMIAISKLMFDVLDLYDLDNEVRSVIDEHGKELIPYSLDETAYSWLAIAPKLLVENNSALSSHKHSVPGFEIVTHRAIRHRESKDGQGL